MRSGFKRSKLSLCIGMVITAAYQNAASAQTHSEDQIDEVVVTSAFRTSEAETAMPVVILSDEELREKVGNSLGTTLQNEIGVAIGSFGTAVGQPIIRGQSANRVKILENNVDVVDVAAQSADHANAVEPLLAERIEVIRGPATLLYGSGAIGGVVNVIDNRIPSALVEGPEFAIEQSHNSVNDEDKTVFRLDAAVGSFGLHLDGFTRESNNVRIDGFAINEPGLESLEEHVEEALGLDHMGHDDHGGDDHGDERDDHGDENNEEYPNTNGFIANSDSKASAFNAGISYVGDRGFLGFSVSELSNEYGLPPGSHAHAHYDEGHEGGHEDEHDGDHDDDHDEHNEESSDEHGEVEFVRLDLERTRYDIRGGLDLEGDFFTRLDGSIALTDYQHGEIEYFEDGDVEVGTLFQSEGYTSRFTLEHASVGDWAGVWGLQLTDSDFSAVGEEAFVPRSDISSMGLFALERFEADSYIVELGARFENSDINAGLPCGFDDSAASLSGSLLYDLNSDSNFMIGIARSQRTPQVEELYANGANIEDACSQGLGSGHHEDDHHDDHDNNLVLHAATNLIEIGNANLDVETSNNLELGYRRHSGAWTGEVSVYRNEIDDFIYLDITGEEIAEQRIARYTARDATFNGFEAKFSYSLFDTGSNQASVSVFGDLVKAEFGSGENVPRIPPSKVGAEVRFSGADWTGHVHVTRHGEQDDPGRLELATPEYTLLSAYADYHIGLGRDSELKLFIRGDNLLDEEVRTHSSMLKNFSPEPGRAISLGLRFEL